MLDRVHAAGDEIVQASLDAGGVLSGEHGIGLEKQPYMARLFAPDDLDAQGRLCDAFDPEGGVEPRQGAAARARVAATTARSPMSPTEPGCDPT